MPVNARQSIFILLNIASVVSLLLCIGSVTWWTRSYAKHQSLGDADSINFTRHDPLYWVISHPGRLNFCRQVGKDWDSPRQRFDVGGLEFAASDLGRSSTLWNLLIPYWMLTAVTLVLPVTTMVQWARWRARRCRRSRGLCAACGYDLRATPGRCPECGAVPAASG
jgi:hypothetical protein